MFVREKSFFCLSLVLVFLLLFLLFAFWCCVLEEAEKQHWCVDHRHLLQKRFHNCSSGIRFLSLFAHAISTRTDVAFTDNILSTWNRQFALECSSFSAFFFPWKLSCMHCRWNCIASAVFAPWRLVPGSSSSSQSGIDRLHNCNCEALCLRPACTCTETDSLRSDEMFAKLALTEEEKTVDEQLGYPHGYAKLCRCHASSAELQHCLQLTPFTEGPPQRFLPYSPQAEDVSFLSENRKKHTHAQITYRNCALASEATSQNRQH